MRNDKTILSPIDPRLARAWRLVEAFADNEARLTNELADARRQIEALELLGACRLDYLNWLSTYAATAIARNLWRLSHEPELPGDWDARLVKVRLDIIKDWDDELDRRGHQRETMRADRERAA
jgi:hypothetical protein